MAQLIIVGYQDMHKAEEVRTTLLKLQREYLLDLEDAVVVTKKKDGKIQIRQAINLPLLGAFEGTFWGALIGLLFLSPLLGAAVGAASGAITGALADVGINDDFIKQVAQTLQPGASALFVLVRQATPDKVLEHLQGTGGTIIKTSLSHEDEAKLQAVLNDVHKSGLSVGAYS